MHDTWLLPRELHRQNTLLLAWMYPGDRRDEDLPDPRDDPRNNGLVQVVGGLTAANIGQP